MKRLTLLAAVLLLAGCVTAARVKTTEPTVVQPSLSPPPTAPAQVRSDYPAVSGSESRESVLTESGSETETVSIPPGPPTIGDVPCQFPRRGTDANRRYVIHMAAPQNPDLGLQPGMAWFESKRDVLGRHGYKLPSGKTGLVKAWLPAGARVQFPLQADDGPDLDSEGLECGCGNQFEDLEKDRSAWRLVSPVNRPAAKRSVRRNDFQRTASAPALQVVTNQPPSQGTNWVQFAGQVRSLSGGRVSPTCWYQYNNWPIGSVGQITAADLSKTAGTQRVSDVDGDLVPFPKDTYSGSLPFDQTIAYQAVCRLDGEIFPGNIVWGDLASPSYCNRHPGVCKGALWAGGIVGSAILGHFIYDLLTPGYNNPTMPCYGQCVPSGTITKPPTWHGDPGGGPIVYPPGTQPPVWQPKPPGWNGGH